MDPLNNPNALGGSPPQVNVKPTQSLFSEAPLAPMPQDQPLPSVSRGKSKVWTRIVVPVVVMMVAIGAVAWVIQFQPGKEGGRNTIVAPTSFNQNEALSWRQSIADWDPETPEAKDKHLEEFEIHQPGHFDFEFENATDNELEMGVNHVTCTCQSVEMALFASDYALAAYRKLRKEKGPMIEPTDMTWKKVEVDKGMRASYVIPAKAKGLLRVSWRAKTEPELLSMEIQHWSRPAGGAHDRNFQKFPIRAQYVNPVRFDLQKPDLGWLSATQSREISINCWSSSRNIDVKAVDGDKRIQVDVHNLNKEECEELNKFLVSTLSLDTKVRSGARLKVKIHEEKDGKTLDMGLLNKALPIVCYSDGKPIEGVEVPQVRASIRGPVSLTAENDRGVIDLGLFSAKSSKTKQVTIMAPKGAKLVFKGGDPDSLELIGDLKQREATDTDSTWELTLTTKANRSPGPFPEESVVVLECHLPAIGDRPAQIRMARIQVTGTAQR
jgi:hypothetical protein